MGRSNGYRPTKANRAEVKYLRELLGKTKGDQWQRAGSIMREITRLLGHRCGPSRGSIQPRVCRLCGYYGHTSQWCPTRGEREARETTVALKAEAKWCAEHSVDRHVDPVRVVWLAWTRDRHKAACDAGWGCSQQAESAADYTWCDCEGCVGWRDFLYSWERSNPEPPRTSERGA